MCNQCEALTINGVYCHEIGCPVAWQDETRECKWCGFEFEPKHKNQVFCEQSCRDDYNN